MRVAKNYTSDPKKEVRKSYAYGFSVSPWQVWWGSGFARCRGDGRKLRCFVCVFVCPSRFWTVP